MITKSKFDGEMPICPNCGKRLLDMSDEDYEHFYASEAAHEADVAMMYRSFDCAHCGKPYLVVQQYIKYYNYEIPFEEWVAGVIFHDWTMTWDEYVYLTLLRKFTNENTTLVETEITISEKGIVLFGTDPNKTR